MRRNNILFVVSEFGEFLSLFEVAQVAEKELSIHPVFLFKADYGALGRHCHMLEAQGYSWALEGSRTEFFDLSQSETPPDDYLPSNLQSIVASKPLQAGQVRPNVSGSSRIGRGKAVALAMLPGIARRLLGRHGQVNGSDYKRPARAWPTSYFGKRFRTVSATFRRFRPALVISGQDYPLSTTAIAAKIAADAGISTLIIPFSMTPTTKEIAESFAELRINRLSRKAARKIVRKHGDRWVQHYKGRFFSRLTPPEIRLCDAYGISPAQPWTPNSGRGTILAPSQQGFDYCRLAGIPDAQLRLTGAMWNDGLREMMATRAARRDVLSHDIDLADTFWRYMRSSNLPQNGTEARAPRQVGRARKLVIVSWPPNQWPRKASGFDTFDEFSLALTESFAALRFAGLIDVAISLHPTLVGTPVAESIRKSGLYVLDAPLTDVLVCADIFIATVSSTLLWAVQLEIPSINFDPYRYQYREFAAAGLAEATSVQGLRAQILSLVENQAVYDERKSAIKENKKYWVSEDGLSRHRILQEISRGMKKCGMGT